MNFAHVIEECIGNKALVTEFNRLSGSSIGVDNRSQLDRMIDEATGHHEEIDEIEKAEMLDFISFVYDCVWVPLAGRLNS